MSYTPDRELDPPSSYWKEVQQSEVEIKSEWWDRFNWDLYDKYLKEI